MHHVLERVPVLNVREILSRMTWHQHAPLNHHQLLVPAFACRLRFRFFDSIPYAIYNGYTCKADLKTNASRALPFWSLYIEQYWKLFISEYFDDVCLWYFSSSSFLIVFIWNSSICAYVFQFSGIQVKCLGTLSRAKNSENFLLPSNHAALEASLVATMVSLRYRL